MIATEDPPAKVSSILLSYDKVKENTHPVSVNYYSKDKDRLACYTVKSALTIEELKQELRASIKSGRKYDYENDRIAIGFADQQ